MNFADRLISACVLKKSRVVVGLDPRWPALPPQLKTGVPQEGGPATAKAVAAAIHQFDRAIIDAVADLAVAIKPQLAFYEIWGAWGMQALIDTVTYARQQDLLVILDGKRGDIGSTAEAYAQAYLGGLSDANEHSWSLSVDSLTINPYFGSDGVKPFIDACTASDGGLFVLVKTSNPSSGELQDRDSEGEPLFARVATMVHKWGQDLVGKSGYSSVGAVVGATYPADAAKLRNLLPRSIFLVPGYGAQGGGAEDALPAFNPDGLGAVVTSSRGIIFAYQKDKQLGAERFADASRAAAMRMRDDINRAIAAHIS